MVARIKRWLIDVLTILGFVAFVAAWTLAYIASSPALTIFSGH